MLEGHRTPCTNARYEQLPERFPAMVKELRRKGATPAAALEGVPVRAPGQVSDSEFCHHFHRWRKSPEMGMHIDHKAGEKLLVDYAGDRLKIVDPDSGKEQPVETFVAILGASDLTYVEESAGQQSDDWIRSNEPAPCYCGRSSPEAIIPDNLRGAVSLSDPYEPGIQSHRQGVRQALWARHHARPRPPGTRQGSGRESANLLATTRLGGPCRCCGASCSRSGDPVGGSVKSRRQRR